MNVAIAVTALGSALVAGAFLAFSSFVMQALGRLPPAHGAAAMQSINITVITPVFMTALFGTALLCLVVAVWALASWDDRAPWTLAGAVLYVVGTTGVTMVANVPRNNRLAALAPEDATDVWADYLRTWTAWNTVRTVAALAAAALLVVALTQGG